MEKKARAINKVFNDMDFTPEEWKIIAFYVYTESRRTIVDNILHFSDGLIHYMNSPHLEKNQHQHRDLRRYDGTH